MEQINIMLDEYGIMPTRAHDTDAGLDIYAPHRIVIYPKDHWKISTGVHIELPANTVAFVKSKSGLMSQGILTDGTIDCGYTGEIGVILFNFGERMKIFERGEKIAQIVIQEVKTPSLNVVDQFEATERGDGGFGSTGR